MESLYDYDMEESKTSRNFRFPRFIYSLHRTFVGLHCGLYELLDRHFGKIERDLGQ